MLIPLLCLLLLAKDTNGDESSDIVCKKGRTSKKINVGEVDSFEFRTQAGATYAPNTNCHVTYIKEKSCPKMRFYCPEFNVNNKHPNCKRKDIMQIRTPQTKRFYCGGKGPNVTTSAKYLKVSFISDKRKQSSGAICRVECETTGEELEMFNELLSKHIWMNSSNQRFLLWKTRKDQIDEHNKLYAENKTTYRKAVNKFTIMFDSEFEAQYKGLSMPKHLNNKKASRQPRVDSETGGKSINWTAEGRVTEVQNQNPHDKNPGCGSCWAFSATGAIEAAYMTDPPGELLKLSEQNLINCMEDETCVSGSNPLEAFHYVREHVISDIPTTTTTTIAETVWHGIALETNVRYEAEKQALKCRGNVDYLHTIKSWVIVNEGELYLQKAVDAVGPVSVLICANTPGFKHYEGGILDVEDCSSYCKESGWVDHAVLVVGYGEETTPKEDNKPYWLVKNSWGTGWGEQGYIKMARNKENQCEIASYVTYPLLEDSPEIEEVVCDREEKNNIFIGDEKNKVYCCDTGETKICTGAKCKTACPPPTTTEEPCVVIVTNDVVNHQPHCDEKPKGSMTVTMGTRALCMRAVRCPVLGSQRGCSCCTQSNFKTKCNHNECFNCPRGEAHYGPLTEEEPAKSVLFLDAHNIFDLPSFKKRDVPVCKVLPYPGDNDGIQSVSAMLNGVLYTCGGRDKTGTPTLEPYKGCFSLENGIWVKINDMLEPRAAFALSPAPNNPNGLLITGGAGSQYLKSTEILTPGMPWIWTQGVPLPKYIRYHCQVTLGSRVIITGGFHGQGGLSAAKSQQSSTYFLREDNTWQVLADMNEKRYLHSCAVLDDTVYVMGGFLSGQTAEKYKYGGKWESIDSFPGNKLISAFVYEDKLYIITEPETLYYLKDGKSWDKVVDKIIDKVTNLDDTNLNPFASQIVAASTLGC